ncbi:MAG: GAF domain-containing protein [Spirochaetes bacterium]|nr:GAF domain-containing protein [Spirochaetota bacterium]
MKNDAAELIVPEETVAKWQEIVDILAQLSKVPAALIMRLRDPDIEVFISNKSEEHPYHAGDTERLWGSGLYCETVISSKGKLLVFDALADERWKNNPDVKHKMISYLGFPILLPNGKPFGTICVLDKKRNKYSVTTERLMLQFRGIVESHLEMIYMNHVLGEKNKRLTEYLMEIQALRGMVTICSNCKSIKDNNGVWHPIEHYLIKHPEAEFSHGLCPKCAEIYSSDSDEDSKQPH